ncbi:MAG: ABC transporter ATP-binding protein [Deltaproteobacteria bacterium]|nr:ABC transporter ATP-binding protein [Deltaproteobacteria bacterium]MBW2052770.1 ABC transporter ATP-binding protein [Deltaproteobacteria bacterium]MBW2142091.1 ABC transporter ATP-binding protein [Deltaproteobacteria bacterium]MBW2324187.1 ABC transporter ATP-binding protein [Deltaproteobacteria bacterium]
MVLLEVSNICKKFNSKLALDEVSFSLEEGRILCLLGPSGCGKTTLLRIIAGLEAPDKGKVVFDEIDIAAIPPHRRQFGMMFQEFALFPHKNVFENVAFGLERQRRTPQEITLLTSQTLDLVGLKGFGQRKINEISGGERQRVALARSLAARPRLLMLDEPLGALDRALRERLILDLRSILKKVGVTAIFVTHDQSEAFTISDFIAVIDRGRIEQIAAPETLYLRPKNQTVARFLGFNNFLEGIILEDGGVQTKIGVFYPDSGKGNKDDEVTLLLRPEAARLIDALTQPADNETIISGMVQERLFHGRNYHLSLKTETGLFLTFEVSNQTPPPQKGKPIRLAVGPAGMAVEPVSVKEQK